MSVGLKTTFLVPRTLTWDKLAALYLLVRAVLPTHRCWGFKELLDTGRIDVRFDGEADVPANVIDVDARRSYKDLGWGSATEKVVREYALDLPGLDRLARLLNHNNRTGNLKGDNDSLVGLIRELHNIGTAEPSRQVRLSVIELFWPVMEAYCRAMEVAEKAASALPNPFTMSSFVTLLTLSNTPQERADRFQQALSRAFERVRTRQQASAERAPNVALHEFRVQIVGTETTGCGCFVETDDTRYAGLHFQQHPNTLVLIVRRRGGNVAIFCRGQQDFTFLYHALEEREPGLWFYENRGSGERSPMLLNGSTSRAAQPTKLTKPQLIEVVQQHHQHISRTRQRR